MIRRTQVVWALAALMAFAGLIVYLMKRGDDVGGFINDTIQSPAARPTDDGPASAPVFSPTLVLNSARTKVADEITNPPKEPSRRAPRNISGTFVDGAGAPVSGGRVFLVTGPEGNKRIREVPTDASGNFQFVNITNTKGWIEGMRPDGALTERAVGLSAVADEQQIVLIANGTPNDRTVIQVLNPNGSPAEKALLFTDTGDGINLLYYTYTSRAGFFSDTTKRVCGYAAVDSRFRYKKQSVGGVAPHSKNLLIQLSEVAPATVVNVFDQKGHAVAPFVYEYMAPTSVALHADDLRRIAKDDGTVNDGARVRIPFETVNLRISARGFFPKTIGPFSINNIPSKIDVEVDRETGLCGIITSGGIPVAKAHIEFLLLDTTNLRPEICDERTSGPDGAFECAAHRKGEYAIKIESDGFGETFIESIIYDPHERSSPLKIELSPAGSLEFFVRDAEGMPIPNLRLTLNSVNRLSDPITAYSATDGHFLFNNLRSGRYKYSVESLSLPYELLSMDDQSHVVVESGKRSDVAIEIPAAKSVCVRMVVNGAPESRGIVTFSRVEHGVNSVDSSDRDAAAKLGETTMLPKGNYHIEVAFEGGEKSMDLSYKRFSINVFEEKQDVLLDLQCGKVSGSIVTDEYDKEDALIKIHWTGANGDEFSANTSTNADGHFEFPLVPAGKCKISVNDGKETTITVEAGKTTNVEL
ncbi:MAG: carboxypeptidase regulatory-like domain-containing protein [Planctomycetes bacterium]|nr:carboxypeptidase regulatory-like domain-containing protein [Planctomycetota bacterium]